jgi:hypothetical protein
MKTAPVKQRDRSAAEKFIQALRQTEEIDLTVTGRVSNRKTTRPVWFVHDNSKIYLLPVKGSGTEWYKNVLKNPTITLSADGKAVTAKIEPITDPARVNEVVEKFRAKYGADEVAKYYSKFDVAAEVELK